MGRCAQVEKGILGDMLYSLYFKGAIAPTMVPGMPFLFWLPSTSSECIHQFCLEKNGMLGILCSFPPGLWLVSIVAVRVLCCLPSQTPGNCVTVITESKCMPRNSHGGGGGRGAVHQSHVAPS